MRDNMKALATSRSARLSAGAVLASVYGRLPHGFSVQYPIDDYVTARGERLEKNPREPDAPVQRVGRGGGAVTNPFPTNFDEKSTYDDTLSSKFGPAAA